MSVKNKVGNGMHHRARAAETEHPQAADAEGLSEGITFGPLTESAEKDPTLWAISYDELMEFERKAATKFANDDYESKTMYDIVDEMIAPLCQRTKRSYALVHNPNGLKIDAFITHAWAEPFASFVRSIVAVFGTKAKRPNLWICSFAIMQGDKESIKHLLDVPLEQAPFVKALKEASEYVVLRNAKTDVYGRLWCVCELMFANTVGLVPDKTHVTGPRAKSTQPVSFRYAKATDPNDWDKIVEALLKNQSRQEIDKFINCFRLHDTPPMQQDEENQLHQDSHSCDKIVDAVQLVSNVVLGQLVSNTVPDFHSQLLSKNNVENELHPTARAETNSNSSNSADEFAEIPLEKHQELRMKIKTYSRMTEFQEIIYRDPSFQKCVTNLQKYVTKGEPQGYTSCSWTERLASREKRAEAWARALKNGETWAEELNEDRRTALALVYHVCNCWKGNKMAQSVTQNDMLSFQPVLRGIVIHGLVLDRANSLFQVRDSNFGLQGKHWYASKDATLQDDEEHETLLIEIGALPPEYVGAGQGTLNKRFLWLRRMNELGLEDVECWMKPTLSPFVQCNQEVLARAQDESNDIVVYKPYYTF